MEELVILVGASALGLLWAFAGLGALASLSDTFGDHLERLFERIKR